MRTWHSILRGNNGGIGFGSPKRKFNIRNDLTSKSNGGFPVNTIMKRIKGALSATDVLQ